MNRWIKDVHRIQPQHILVILFMCGSTRGRVGDVHLGVRACEGQVHGLCNLFRLHSIQLKMLSTVPCSRLPQRN